MGSSNDVLTKYGAQFAAPSSRFSGLALNEWKSDDRQMFDQAERNFINATLRRESGAVISNEEFDNARQQYIPLPGDGTAVLEAKRLNREQILTGLRLEGGAAYTEIVGALVDKYTDEQTNSETNSEPKSASFEDASFPTIDPAPTTRYIMPSGQMRRYGDPIAILPTIDPAPTRVRTLTGQMRRGN
jgi:hypothetical protein